MTDSILSNKERRNLEALITQARDARQTLRAYALIWLDDGESVPEVAGRLDITRQTVYNWMSRFQPPRLARHRLPPDGCAALRATLHSDWHH